MRRYLLHFHVWLARVGWALPAMLVSLGIAFVLLVWGATSERLAIAKTKVEIQKTNAQLSQPAKPPLSPQATAVRDLSAFYRSLGRYPSIEEPVGTLFRMASSAGLVLKQGEYAVTYERSGRYYTYHVALPVHGSYRSIRQFCEGTLSAIPYASLDAIQFKRGAISDVTIDAKLQFTFYLSDAPSAGAAPASPAAGSKETT